MSIRPWLLLAGADGAVRRLARGTVEWQVELFQPGLPVVISTIDELRVLHEGGLFAGWPMPVPAIDPALHATWLARGIRADTYRTDRGFQRALNARRACARSLRDSGRAWGAFDLPRLSGPAARPALPAPEAWA